MSDCIFCKIADGAIPADKVYEDDNFLAFHDINPKAKVHVLVIPKKHIPTFMDIAEEDLPLMAELHKVIQGVARELKIDEKGFRLVNNCKEFGGQEVYHLHYHILGGEKLTHNGISQKY